MNLLILKLILAPVIIGSASLAGRKWGPAVSGWIIGLPLTTGPVVFFLALSHDAAFAASATLGVISGGISLVIYALTYAWIATRFRWQAAIIGSLTAFLICTAILQNLSFPLFPVFFTVIGAIVLSLRMIPNGQVEPSSASAGRWDIPARILIGTGFILLLTGSAPFIGPRLTGLLATIPLYASILTVFAHRRQGAAAASHVLRGLLHGLFAFAGFFLTLNLLLERASLAAAFLSAILVALTVQGASLRSLRQARP
ncbi:MAG: hypothetical protein HFACDABA_02991 [Anaerolineales bacterium]|nr:hypothetical protein [Anaerolineales bacterium]